jgi:2-polyprenyl-6-methoxyphenol hydroxylase-like FAD-dependent oxidoreductase
MNWVHYDMEEVLLHVASDAGAEVRRGVQVRNVIPGELPVVSIEGPSGVCDLHARLVVGADGRSSNVRRWASFNVQRDNYGLLIAGVLLEMPMIDPEANCFVLNPRNGSGVFIAPQSSGRARAYVGIPRISSHRFQGVPDLPLFVQHSVAAGAPSQWYSDIRPIGPLATFDGADTWVDSPFNNGVVLIGDAASSSDPTYGQGQALSLRDARVLSEHLIATDDWHTAARAYTEAHDRYYGALHRFTEWFWQLFLETGPAADVRRARALPPLAEDPTRLPDVLTSGPDVILDEVVRRWLFAEL